MVKDTEISAQHRDPLLISEAIDHHNAGRLQEAERIYSQVLQSDPDHPDALHLLGVLSLQVGKLETAIDLIGRAATLSPDFAEVHCNLGNALKAASKLGEAIECFNRALALKPNYVEAAYNLGNALRDQQKFEEALVSYEKALAIRPDYVDALNNIGGLLKSLNKLDEAAEKYQTALVVNPEFAELHSNLGATRKEQGRLDEAEACFKQAIRFKPDFAAAHYNLGLVQQLDKRMDEAAASFNQAIIIEPEFAEAYNDLGNIYLDLGEADVAVENYRIAIALKPDSAEAFVNLGHAQKNLNKLPEAIVSYQSAAAIRPDYCEAYNSIGLTLQDMGWLEEAMDCFQHALTLRPDYSDASFNLGRALSHQGKYKDAIGFFQHSFGHRTGIKPVGPADVFPGANAFLLELTNKCNFHCNFCPSDSQKRTLGFMQYELAKRMYEEVAETQFVNCVDLHLMGEPTLHPKLIDILQFGASLKVRTELVTNGSTLVEKVVPPLLDALYGTLVASHMTPTEDTYHYRGKVGLSWDRYIDNIRLLVREYMKRLSSGTPVHNEIELRIMITKDTASNVNIIDSSQKALAILTEWSDFTADLERELKMPAFDRQPPNTETLFLHDQQPVKKYRLQRGIVLTFWEAFTFANTRVSEEYELQVKDEAVFCPHPFTDFGVLWNGDVTLCCLDYDGQLKVGNIADDSIENMVQSDAANDIRASMLGRKPLAPVCQKCQARPVKREISSP